MDWVGERLGGEVGSGGEDAGAGFRRAYVGLGGIDGRLALGGW